MIPRRPAQLFRSRWSALWWAFTVIVGAVLTIGPDDSQPANGGDTAALSVSAADARAVGSMLEGR